MMGLVDKLKNKWQSLPMKWKRQILIQKKAQIHKSVKIYGNLKVLHPKNLVIGKHVTLNEGVFLGARGGIEIGGYCRISPNVVIMSSGLNPKQFPREHFEAKVTIEDNVWIATGVIVNPGVRIGKNSIIGAGAVVTKDISPNCFYAGVPATYVKALKTEA